MISLQQLVVSRATVYKFRVRGSRESLEDYRAALIPFLEERDFAAAHEVRVGREQPEWTEDDVLAFKVYLEARGGPREELEVGESMLMPMLPAGTFPATNASLLELADRALAAASSIRSADPVKDVPILVTLLMVNGESFIFGVSRSDRVVAVKTAVQTMPVFGFVVVADMLLHGMSLPGGAVAVAAKKLDAFVAHVGSRDLRVMKIRSYAVDRDANRVVWHPPFPDQDLREPGVAAQDPYAHVFVSVPRSARPQ